MKLPQKNRCVVIIPDTGPLISLNKIKRLDLLKITDLPIIIVDMVYHELTANSDKFTDQAELIEFIKNDTLQVITDVGEMFKDARTYQIQNNQVIPKMGRHFGEYAILDFINKNLDDINSKYPSLVLFEDNSIPKMFTAYQDKVHLLSTVGFLKKLEENHIIHSATDIIDEIKNNGRNMNLLDIDKETTNGSFYLPLM